MTNPPQGGDEPAWGSGEPYDPDSHPTTPVPSFERPPGPGYGPPQHYGPPPAYPARPYGHYQPAPHGPPPYGPPYGPPQPPPRKSRVGLVVALTVGALVLIGGAVVLAFALSSTVLDRSAVERDVAAQFQEREGVAIELDCAEEMKVERGATYECTGTTADDEDVTLQIAITDEETAAYTWTEP